MIRNAPFPLAVQGPVQTKLYRRRETLLDAREPCARWTGSRCLGRNKIAICWLLNLRARWEGRCRRLLAGWFLRGNVPGLLLGASRIRFLEIYRRYRCFLFWSSSMILLYVISVLGVLSNGRTHCDFLSCPLRRWYISNGRSRWYRCWRQGKSHRGSKCISLGICSRWLLLLSLIYCSVRMICMVADATHTWQW